jgi:hypothetical protein
MRRHVARTGEDIGDSEPLPPKRPGYSEGTAFTTGRGAEPRNGIKS